MYGNLAGPVDEILADEETRLADSTFLDDPRSRSNEFQKEERRRKERKEAIEGSNRNSVVSRCLYGDAVMRVSRRRVVRSANVGTKFTRDRRVKMALLPIDQARLGESLQGRCTRPRDPRKSMCTLPPSPATPLG